MQLITCGISHEEKTVSCVSHLLGDDLLIQYNAPKSSIKPNREQEAAPCGNATDLIEEGCTRCNTKELFSSDFESFQH